MLKILSSLTIQNEIKPTKEPNQMDKNDSFQSYQTIK